MPLNLRWTGRNETDLIALTRLRCYGAKAGDLDSFRDRTTNDRFADGDVLLAEQGGKFVGTATSLSLSMSVRGAMLPCQGVAWVGTTRADRRRRIDGHGIASTVMRSIVSKARERGDVVSALMPFRASFYEHFGYGVVERQNLWTVPIATLPESSREETSWRFEEPDDDAALIHLYDVHARRGHGEVVTSQSGLVHWRHADAQRGFRFVLPARSSPARGFVEKTEEVLNASCTVVTNSVNGKTIAQIDRATWRDDEAFASLLAFLSTFKDQYSAVRLTLPADVPLNWRLIERQLPHRPVDHPTATCEGITRMQARVLDHEKFCAALRVAPHIRGETVVVVKESEGTEARFLLMFDAGLVSASSTMRTPNVTMTDVTWAAVAFGELRASVARRAGLIEGERVGLLDALADGPVPFCTEYF